MLLTLSVTLPEYKLVQFEFQMKSTLTREEIEGIIEDEDMLFNWIRKLNAKGQTVFISTVIEMV